VQRPERLTSSATLLNQWIIPLLFWAGWLFIIGAGLTNPRGMLLLAIGWGIPCVLLLVWARLIKEVSIEGDFFVISGHFATHHVPIAHLANIAVVRWSRTPAINLYFEPPTPFGRRIIIIPPYQFFSRERFDEVFTFLKALSSQQDD